MNVMSFIKAATRGAVPVADDQPLPVGSAPLTAGTVEIPAGAMGLSAAIDLGGARLIAIQTPADWDASAVSITFQGSVTGVDGTFVDIDDDGAPYVLPAAPSRGLSISGDVLAGWRYLKIRSGTSGDPVNQTTAPTLLYNKAP